MQGFEYSGTELEALAEANNYYAWIVEQFRPWLAGNVVEVGAGIGTFAERLLAEPAIGSLHLFEPDAAMAQALAARFDGEDRARVVRGVFDAAVLPAPADAIVLVNVLEHIADDAGFARAAHAALRPGGALLLFVPAMPWLFGSLDRAFEHERRYTRASMRDVLHAGGFEIQRLRYMNLPGTISWWLAGRMLRLNSIDPESIRLYDRWIIPIVRAFERRLPPPVGQNLLAIACRRQD